MPALSNIAGILHGFQQARHQNFLVLKHLRTNYLRLRVFTYKLQFMTYQHAIIMLSYRNINISRSIPSQQRNNSYDIYKQHQLCKYTSHTNQTSHNHTNSFYPDIHVSLVVGPTKLQKWLWQ